MNEHEVATILTYCAGIDPRFNTPDEDQAKVRVRVWLDQLRDVDGAWALDFVRRYYSTVRTWSVTPAEIKAAWGHWCDRNESIARTRKLHEIGAGGTPTSESSRAAIDAAKAEIAEAQARFEALPRHPRQPRVVVRDDA